MAAALSHLATVALLGTASQVTNVYALRMAAVFMISLSTTWHRSGTAPR